jgi:hypothetical protein
MAPHSWSQALLGLTVLVAPLRCAVERPVLTQYLQRRPTHTARPPAAFAAPILAPSSMQLLRNLGAHKGLQGACGRQKLVVPGRCAVRKACRREIRMMAWKLSKKDRRRIPDEVSPAAAVSSGNQAGPHGLPALLYPHSLSCLENAIRADRRPPASTPTCSRSSGTAWASSRRSCRRAPWCWTSGPTTRSSRSLCSRGARPPARTARGTLLTARGRQRARPPSRGVRRQRAPPRERARVARGA